MYHPSQLLPASPTQHARSPNMPHQQQLQHQLGSAPPIIRKASVSHISHILHRPSSATVSPDHVVTLLKSSVSWSTFLHSSQDDKIISPPFGPPTSLYTIMLYPRGISEGKGSYLSAYLRPLKSDLEMSMGDTWYRPVVAFTISIRHPAVTGESPIHDSPAVLVSETSAANFRGFSNQVPAWGFTRLLELSKLPEATDAADPCIIIDCDVMWEEAVAFSVIGTSVQVQEGQVDQVASQVFGLEEAPWYLRVVPNGEAEGLGSHISVYLVPIKTSVEEAIGDVWSRPIISFTLRAKSMQGHLLATKTTTGGLAFTNSKPELGFPQLVELAKLAGYGGLVIESELVMDRSTLDPSTSLGKTRIALASQRSLASTPATDTSSQQYQYIQTELWKSQQEVAELKAQLEALASANVESAPQNGEPSYADKAEIKCLREELETAKRQLGEMEIQSAYALSTPGPPKGQNSMIASGLSPAIDLNSLIPNSISQVKAEIKSANAVLMEATAKAPKLPLTTDNEPDRLAIVAELTMKEAELEVARASLAHSLAKGPSQNRNVYAKDIDSGKKELIDSLAAIRALKAELEGKAPPKVPVAAAGASAIAIAPPPLQKPVPHHLHTSNAPPSVSLGKHRGSSTPDDPKTELETLKERILVAKHVLDGDGHVDITPRGRRMSHTGLSPQRFSQPFISSTLEGRQLEVLIRELQAARHRYRRKTSVITASIYSLLIAFVVYSTLFVACGPREPGSRMPMTCQAYILPTYEKAQPLIAAAGSYWHHASEWAVSEVAPKILVAVEGGAFAIEKSWEIAKSGITRAARLGSAKVPPSTQYNYHNPETNEAPRPMDLVSPRETICSNSSHTLTTDCGTPSMPTIKSLATSAIEPSIEATSTRYAVANEAIEELVTASADSILFRAGTAAKVSIETAVAAANGIVENNGQLSGTSTKKTEEYAPPPEPAMAPMAQGYDDDDDDMMSHGHETDGYEGVDHGSKGEVLFPHGTEESEGYGGSDDGEFESQASGSQVDDGNEAPYETYEQPHKFPQQHQERDEL
ncbi:hypothetical protein SeMB42_g03316 [Synchytrium endobioticum]|uniref:MATH domain-containing protein n=1 Tax=Synchytrium endobioticum TaxID=286115 RepID=A0A507D7G5_9FUNG|nr:hypothetical protein SeMB42_g03316 [Synchytrium endobioticum]